MEHEVVVLQIPGKYQALHRPRAGDVDFCTVREAMALTGLSKQTICSLLGKGYVQYTQTDRRGRYTKKTVLLPAAKPVKKWLIPDRTMRALVRAVRPNAEGWPTADKVAQRIEASTAYVLKQYEQGRVRGQQSIVRQRVHIHPEDAARLAPQCTYPYAVARVSRLTGLGASTIVDVARRGYFTRKYTNAAGEVVAERVPVHTRKHLGQYRFSRETVSRLLECVRPVHLHWPTAGRIEEHYGLSRGTVSRHFNRGQIRGCISLKGQGTRLHIHPCDVRLLAWRYRYSLKPAAQRAGVSVTVLRQWNRRVRAPFLKRGLGRDLYVPPHVLGRIRLLVKHGALNSGTAEMLAAPYQDFLRSIQNHVFDTLVYDGDHPPSVNECREGMHIVFPDRRQGKITRIEKHRYRPAIEVLLPNEERQGERCLYAVARS